MPRKTIKVVSLLLCFVLIFQQSGFAQVAGQIDISGYFSQLGSYLAQDKFRPVHLRYLAYNPEENSFKLLLDKGDQIKSSEGRVVRVEGQELKTQTQELLNYFFVGLSLPNESFWVNLRPEAEGTVPRFGTVPDPQGIIDPFLERTDIGRILLEADVQLKKDTARFTSPETQEGRKYWDRLYKKAEELFGTTQVTIPTLVRPWIVPNEIIIREAPDNAYIYKASLKVLLEEDYLSPTKSLRGAEGDEAISGIASSVASLLPRNDTFSDSRLKALNHYSSELIKELIIPKLTKRINSAKDYAPLRQVYYSLILAQWFKARNKGQSPPPPLAGQVGTVPVLIDSRNLTNLTSKEPWSKATYFQQYQKSFKKGEYNLKEQVSTPYGQVIRTYVSGGISLPMEIPQQIPKPGESFHNASSSVTTIGADPAKEPPLGKTIIGAKFDANTERVSLEEDRRIIEKNTEIEYPDKPRMVIEPFRQLRGLEWSRFITFAKKEAASGVDDARLEDWFGEKKTSLRDKVPKSPPSRTETHVFQQTGKLFNLVLELVDNAIDATLKDSGQNIPIGQFGEGALQSLSLLGEDLEVNRYGYEGDCVTWTTSTAEDNGRQARRLIFYQSQGGINLDFEEREGAYKKGTRVQVRSAKLKGRIQELEEYIRAAYEDSDQVMVYLNGELVNNRKNIIEINGQHIDYMVKDRVVSIITNEDGFSIQDEAMGMDKRTLLLTLPIPRRGTNQDIRKHLKDNPEAHATSLCIENELTDAEHPEMKVVFVVGSRVMDVFTVRSEGVALPRRIRIKLPLFTKLTDAKDSIIIDETTRSALDYLISRLSQAKTEHIFGLINGLSQVMRYLEDKAASGDFNFVDSFVQKVKTQILLPYLEQHKVIFLPNKEKVRDLRLSVEREIVYLEDMFFAHDNELLDRCLEDVPFVSGVSGGRVYCLPLVEGEEPLLVYSRDNGQSVLFIDERLRQTLFRQDVSEDAQMLLGALLEAAQIRGYVVISDGIDGEKMYRAILGQIPRFQELGSTTQNRIIRRLADAKVDEEVLQTLAALTCGESPKETDRAQPASQYQEDVSIKHLPVTDVLKSLLSDGLEFKQVSSGRVNGRELVVMRDSYLPTQFVVMDLKGEVVFDSQEAVRVLTESQQWKKQFKKMPVTITNVSIEDNQLLINCHVRHNKQKFFMFLTALGELIVAAISYRNLLPYTNIGSVEEWFVSAGILGFIFTFIREIAYLIKKDNQGKMLFPRTFFNLARFTALGALVERSGNYYLHNGIDFSVGALPILVFGAVILPLYFIIGEVVQRFFPLYTRADVIGLIKAAFKNTILEAVEARLEIAMEGNMKDTAAVTDLTTEDIPKVLTKGSHKDNIYFSRDGEVYKKSHTPKGIRITKMTQSGKKVTWQALIVIPREENVGKVFVDGRGIVIISYDEVDWRSQKIYFYDKKTGSVSQEYFKTDYGTYSDEVFGKGEKWYVVGYKSFQEISSIRIYEPSLGRLRTLPWPQDLVSASQRQMLDDGQRYILLYGKSQGDTFFNVLDTYTERIYSLGNAEGLGISEPSIFIQESDANLVIIGKRDFYDKNNASSISALKITLPKESISESDSHIDDSQKDNPLQRQSRLIDNLQYAPAHLLRKEDAQILAYIHYEILSKLSDEMVSNILGFLGQHPERKEGFLRFFEVLETVLQEYSPEQVNVIIRNWLGEYSSDGFDEAMAFISAMEQEYSIGGQRIRGVRLLEEKFFADAPDFIRGFWLRLKQKQTLNLPEREDVVPLFSGGKVVAGFANVPLAKVLMSRDRMDRKEVGIEEYQAMLPGVMGDEAGYNQEIFSAVTGQDPTTAMREGIQNGRDAIREVLAVEPIQGRIEVRIFVIRKGQGYELVTEIQDNGIGMDDKVILNKLLPLDETTKRQHMGQGFYTLWAETKPGDRVEVETTRGDGNGYALRQSKNREGIIIIDSLHKVKIPVLKDGGVRGSIIRQQRNFATLGEARQQFEKLTARLKFYCGAVSDVDIYFNGERINEDLQVASEVRFGELGTTRFLLGDGHNRMTQDELAMPVPLNVATERQRYWSVIPSEVQEELLHQGITTDIAGGLLLTKARTEPAFEEYLPYIRRSESLKAMLCLAGRISTIKNPVILENIKEALEKAEDMERQYPELNQIAGELNYVDTEADGQRQFHRVSEEDMLKHWYQLLIRMKLETTDNLSNTQSAVSSSSPLSLLDVYRQKNGKKAMDYSKIDIPVEKRFTLPQAQYKESPPVKKERDCARLPQPIRNILLAIILYSMLLPFLPIVRDNVVPALRDNIVAPVQVVIEAVEFRWLDWFDSGKDIIDYDLSIPQEKTHTTKRVERSSQRRDTRNYSRRDTTPKDSRGKPEKGAQTKEELENLLSEAKKETGQKMKFDDNLKTWMQRRSDEQEMRNNQEAAPGGDSGTLVKRILPLSGSAEVLADVSGMAVGEYAILSYNPYVGPAGMYSSPHLKIIPQGELTGEEVFFDYVIGRARAGEQVPLFQLRDGELRLHTIAGEHHRRWNWSTIEQGYITAKEDIPNETELRVHIYRMTQNNRIEYDENIDQKWLEGDFNYGSKGEFQDMPQEWKSALEPVKGKEVPLAEKLKAIDKLMRDYFEYYDMVSVVCSQSWMSTANKLLRQGHKIVGPCYIMTIYRHIFLRYVGLKAVAGNVYVYKGKNIIPSNTNHADNYIVLPDGTIQEARWENAGVRIGSSVNDYSVDNYNGEVDMGSIEKRDTQLRLDSPYDSGQNEQVIKEREHPIAADTGTSPTLNQQPQDYTPPKDYSSFVHELDNAQRPVAIYWNREDKPIGVKRLDLFAESNKREPGEVKCYKWGAKPEENQLYTITFDADGKVTQFSVSAFDSNDGHSTQEKSTLDSEGRKLEVSFDRLEDHPVCVVPTSEQVKEKGFTAGRAKTSEIFNGKQEIIEFDAAGRVTSHRTEDIRPLVWEDGIDSFASNLYYDTSGRPLEVWSKFGGEAQNGKPCRVERLDIFPDTPTPASDGTFLNHDWKTGQDYLVSFDASGEVTNVEAVGEPWHHDIIEADSKGKPIRILLNDKYVPLKVEEETDDMGRRKQVSSSGHADILMYVPSATNTGKYEAKKLSIDFDAQGKVTKVSEGTTDSRQPQGDTIQPTDQSEETDKREPQVVKPQEQKDEPPAPADEEQPSQKETEQEGKQGFQDIFIGVKIAGILGAILGLSPFILRLGNYLKARLNKKATPRKVRVKEHQKPVEVATSLADALISLSQIGEAKPVSPLPSKTEVMLSPSEKISAQGLLSNLIRFILRTHNDIPVIFISDESLPKIFLKDGVVRINAYYYQDAIKELKSSLDHSGDRNALEKEWVALALQSAYLHSKGLTDRQGINKKDEVIYYAQRMAFLIRNYGIVRQIFDSPYQQKITFPEDVISEASSPLVNQPNGTSQSDASNSNVAPVGGIDGSTTLTTGGSASSPVDLNNTNKGGNHNSTSSPLTADTDVKKGGIDFTVLPIATRPVSNPFTPNSLPLTTKMGQSLQLNLDAELLQIQRMVERGFIPSTQRLKDYVASCAKSGDGQIERVLSCIADIFRLEEDNVIETDSGLKELLTILESGKNIQELVTAIKG